MKRNKRPDSKVFCGCRTRAPSRREVARKTARMHGTPIYVWKDGKVVAEKP
jgi:hypothetical protein